MTSHLRYTHYAVLLSSSICLTGCSSLLFPSVEPPPRYVLDKIKENTSPPSYHHHDLKTILVTKPHLYAPLNTKRVAVMLQNHRLDYFAEIEWADQLEKLIQDSLIFSLQDDHRFTTIVREQDSLYSHLILKIDVRTFYIDQTQCPFVAKVDYFVTLTEMQNEARISSRSRLFSSAVPLPKDLSYDDLPKKIISNTLNQANQQVVTNIINWL